MVASASTGAVTLSLPQSIATTSNVTFNTLTATGLVTGTVGHLNLMTGAIATNTGQALATTDSSSSTVIAWDSLLTYGPTGGKITYSAGVLTVPFEGIYQINASLRVVSGVQGKHIQLYVADGTGSAYVRRAEASVQNYTNTTRDFLTLSTAYFMAAGESFKITGFISATVTGDEIVNDTANRLSVVYLGDGS